MSIVNKIALYRCCLKSLASDFKQLALGQKVDYELLQLSHRLEKGLLITNPKPLWGWEKAYRIIHLLSKDNNQFSADTANAVLSAYLDAKSKSSFQEDRDKYESFMRDTGFIKVRYENLGGTQLINRNIFNEQEQEIIRRLFNTRHSCRDFAERPILDKDLEEAVKMAQRCPSACNRQPFRVYAIDPDKLAKKLGRNSLQYRCSRTLIITGDIRAFNAGELLDWIVNPSIFAAYLTLSLHSLGIGSCVIRKDLVAHSNYNEVVREITGMDASERIVLEIMIGYYKEEFHIPCSNRENISHFIKII